MNITSLDILKEKAKGEMVELPGWDEENLVCRVKRVSILGLASKGSIPNSLLTAATKVFTSKVDTNTSLKEICDVMKVIARETLVNPTYEQIEECGLTLTDEQLTALLNYSQQGVRALEKFRTVKPNNKDNKSEQDLQQKAE